MIQHHHLALEHSGDLNNEHLNNKLLLVRYSNGSLVINVTSFSSISYYSNSEIDLKNVLERIQVTWTKKL